MRLKPAFADELPDSFRNEYFHICATGFWCADCLDRIRSNDASSSQPMSIDTTSLISAAPATYPTSRFPGMPYETSCCLC
jgi:hypothetical protein